MLSAHKRQLIESAKTGTRFQNAPIEIKLVYPPPREVDVVRSSQGHMNKAQHSQRWTLGAP